MTQYSEISAGLMQAQPGTKKLNLTDDSGLYKTHNSI